MNEIKRLNKLWIVPTLLFFNFVTVSHIQDYGADYQAAVLQDGASYVVGDSLRADSSMYNIILQAQTARLTDSLMIKFLRSSEQLDYVPENIFRRIVKLDPSFAWQLRYVRGDGYDFTFVLVSQKWDAYTKVTYRTVQRAKDLTDNPFLFARYGWDGKDMVLTTVVATTGKMIFVIIWLLIVETFWLGLVSYISYFIIRLSAKLIVK
ncbi:MAG: hypothetical protein ACKKL5_03950 [Candidatus Komeilibacteria bacterium]